MAMAVDMKVLCHPSQSHWYPWEKDKQVIMMAGVVHLWCTLLCHWRLSYHTQLSAWVLRVSALHYSAGDWVSGGFRTVASARALRQPTSCGSEYFYNQCPQVRNLIGTECSLIEVNVGLRRKQAKSNSIDRGIPSEWESDCRSRMNVGSDQRSSRQWEQ